MSESNEAQIRSSSVENENENYLDNQEKFRFIDEIRLHNDNSVYPYQQDDNEIDRLHSQHYLLRMVWQNNFSVPIKQQLIEGGMHVLDIGTGSGIWILEMASEYPLTTFKGIDVNQLFPTDCSPKNSEFIQCDVLEGLPFEDETFDFVHVRFLIPAFTQDQWENVLLRETLRVCKIGGWVQFMEWDPRCINEGPKIKTFTDNIMEFIKSKHGNPMITERLDDQLLSTKKFSSVKHEHKYCPTGSWGGTLGKMGLNDFVQVTKAVSSPFSNFLNMSLQEYEKFVQDCVQEFEVSRTYTKTHRYYGQKISN
ncbi:16354_t:CDS:2 [Funneliformis mosseae]|uniref:16354_t:CDS:1 n=1 Tax=Funneliformis mosseae TaxID=27381 RepID=A0A9N9DJ14_FUNMO|nr:16354_t:CDS:2 [Funneliformis mosseae]